MTLYATDQISYSIQTAVSDGSLTRIVVGLEYLSKDDISVWVDDVEIPESAPDGYVWAWDGDDIVFENPIPKGSIVRIRRTTARDAMFNVFSGRAEFSNRTMDENFQQLLYLAQEYSEGAGLSGVISNLNMNGYKIYNVGKATEPNDVVTLGQYQADALGAHKAKEEAEAIANDLKEYTFEIPNVVNSIEELASKEDGFYAITGMGTTSDAEDISNRVVKSEGSTELRSLGERFADVVNVRDHGAKGDGVTDDTEAFNKAGEVGVVYVPRGTYLLSNPYDIGQKYQYFGEGKLVFKNAEHRRKGGSSGSTDVQERYTLFYLYNDKSDVSITFDGTPQEFSWLTNTTILAPGSESGVDVRINISNGYRYLSHIPESIRMFSTYGSGGENVIPSDDPASIATGNNDSYGSLALRDITSGGNNTAFGSKTLMTTTTGGNNVAMGYQALYRQNGNNNTALGCIAGEWLETGDGNTFIGSQAGAGCKTANYTTAIGYSAKGEGNGDYNTALGYRALGNHGLNECESSTAIGAFAGDFAYGNSNTFVGYRAGNGDSTSYSDGAENVAIGFMAMRNLKGATKNVVIGAAAAQNIVNQQENIILGYGAGKSVTGNKSVIIGSNAGYSATSGAVIIGYQAAQNSTGIGTTVVGNGAGLNLTTGENNTFIGSGAGVFDYTGNPTQTISNCSAIGQNARVDGDNQVQLGNAATTVYTYGAVQQRSDERDKTDIQDTKLGLAFILKLRPVDYRWDYRDDYIEEVSDGVDEEGNQKTKIVLHPRDGSKKRTRFHHGFIAQEVKATADELGIDFGGYQDHVVKGGGDVKSLGYEELIAPLVKSIQELSKKVENLEKRLSWTGV